MVKALIAAVVVAGIVLIIIGAVSGEVALAIVGDVLVVGGVLMYWSVKRSAAPSAELRSEQVAEPEPPGQRVEEESMPTAVENDAGGRDLDNNSER